MSVSIITVFIIGYLAIAFEHKIKIDKAASALVTGVLCWLIYFIHSAASAHLPEQELIGHLGDISSILFFLLGAMTIVEVVDSHKGFAMITRSIQTRSKVKLLILVATITFFMSAVLDNLTTAIVMASLCQKILTDKNDRLWFASMVIIAANAGGAWSPLGDVTTTMLWIGGQIGATDIILKTIVPSIIVTAIPLAIVALKFKKQKLDYPDPGKEKHPAESNFMLITGICLLIFVPFFKIISHMPPFMGMLLALGMIWFASSILHLRKHPEERYQYSVTKALRNIDVSSILFFLGILLAVSALQSFGILNKLSATLMSHVQDIYITGTILGILSALIDNVPLVAAAQGMFPMDLYPAGHSFWEFLALSAGTGGSSLLIGSAAGIAVAGIEKMNFIWYLKRISLLALAGFTGGLAVYMLQMWLIH